MKDKIQYYIATRLENHANHNRLRDALNATEHCECTYDWTIHGPVWRDGLERIREVAKLELDGVTSADVVVVLLPGGRGTHAELGMALARGSQIVIISDTPEDHFEARTETCAFYHGPNTLQLPSTTPLDKQVDAIIEWAARGADWLGIDLRRSTT